MCVSNLVRINIASQTHINIATVISSQFKQFQKKGFKTRENLS